MSLYTWLTQCSRKFYDLSTTRYNNWTSENSSNNISYLEEYVNTVRPTVNDDKIKEYMAEIFEEKKNEMIDEIVQKLTEDEE